MPDVPGRELVTRLADMQSEARCCSCPAVLRKPFTGDELTAKVGQALARPSGGS